MGSGIYLQTDPQFIDLKILIPLRTTMLLDQTATKSGTVTHTGRKKSSDGLSSRCQRYTYVSLSSVRVSEWSLYITWYSSSIQMPEQKITPHTQFPAVVSLSWPHTTWKFAGFFICNLYLTALVEGHPVATWHDLWFHKRLSVGGKRYDDKRRIRSRIFRRTCTRRLTRTKVEHVPARRGGRAGGRAPWLWERVCLRPEKMKTHVMRACSGGGVALCQLTSMTQNTPERPSRPVRT